MFKIYLFCMCLQVYLMKQLVASFPVGARGGLEVPPPEVLKFMRRFGYLEQNPDDSEALYHETAIIEAIKNIQKYGALNQTGKLDVATLALFAKPRCGVPDIEGNRYYLRQQPNQNITSLKARSKRFIFGAKTWSKRNIKYLIGNWSLKIPHQQVERDIARALEVWSQYSKLKFYRVDDTSADIIVGFGSQYHGDNYPFDGPGNILAHAFYPYEMGSWGGDVHFDEDENWQENSTDLAKGVDFYTVALHELGHSLGLAHSPVYNSIMFPYYKGPEHNVLDFDDTLAMYNAYLNKKLEDDVVEIASEDGAATEATTQLESTTEFLTQSSAGVGRSKQKYTTTSPNRPAQGAFHHSATPNICEGSFDAVCYFNQAMHIFKGEFVWRVTSKYRVSWGYPKRLQQLFSDLPHHIKHIDACYERFDKTLVLFSGQQVWFYKNNAVLANSSSVTLQELVGDTEGKEKINAALLWPKNNRTYLFADTIFWRVNDELKSVDKDYPKPMSRWPGIPEDIDAAATLPNGKTYFFKENLYWLYNNSRVHPERGYPRRAATAWLGCSTRTTHLPFRNNNTTVSFIYASSVKPLTSSRSPLMSPLLKTQTRPEKSVP